MKIKKLLGLGLGVGLLVIAVSCKKDVTYTIKFVDYDQTLLQEIVVNEGELPNYTLDEPTRESTAQYSYTFSGWDKDITIASSEVVYTATYDESVNTYRVTFKNEDGKVLDTQILEYGSTPEYKRNDPTKAPKDEYTYRFDGWDKELVKVTGDVTYTATFKELTKSYTVSFIDLSGKTLYSSEFEYGEIPVYKGSTPTLEGNDKYSYVFAGWTEELSPVEQDTTYRVKFDQVVNKYNIKFYDEDFNLLESKEVEYGQVPEFTGTYPNLPENTTMYSYSGSWDKELAEVTKDDIYVYEVNRTKNKYLVKFVNYDDSVLLEDEIEYGETPVYSLDTPTKPSIVSEGYVFKGWDKTLSPVTSEITYKAQYDSVVAKYLINFVYEGEVLESKEVEYGQLPEFTGALPETPLNTNQYSYSPGWDKVIKKVSGETTYTYSLNQTLNSYEVTFNHLFLDGSVASDAVKETKLFNELESYKGVYTYTAPTVEGYVPSHDYIKYTVDGENLVYNIYYSEVDTLTSETVASSSLSGSGTESDPYLISSAADLLCFKNNIATYGASGVYVKMTKSIDLEVENFRITDNMSGIFDANNCTIRGVNIVSSEGCSALFKQIQAGSIVKNLSLYGSVNETGATYSSAFVYLLYGTLDNCYNYCEVSGSAARIAAFASSFKNGSIVSNCVNYANITSTTSRVGGLVGWADSLSKLLNSINYGNISGSTDIGGLFGYCQGSKALVDGCKNFGTVTSTSTATDTQIGGIVGYASIGGISNTVNYGSVTGKGYSGSIMGRFNNADKTISNCLNYGTITGSKFAFAGVEGYENFVSIVAYNNGGAAASMFVDCYDYGTIVDL